MNDAPETKQCTNCKLEIISSNYTIHSVHCQRNFYFCSKCEQPVNFSDRAEHDNGNHINVQCTNCQLELEKYLLDDHLINDCPYRKVKCQICDIEVKATDITEHEDYCGSRTEKCGECGQFVMLKFKSLHIDSNHTFLKLSDEPAPSPSWQYGRRTLCNFLPDISAYKSGTAAKRKSNDYRKQSRNSESNDFDNDSDEISRKNFDKLMSEKGNHVDSKMENMFKMNNSKKGTRRDLEEWPALSSLRSLQLSDEGDDISNGMNNSNYIGNKADEETDLMYAIKVSEEINSDIWKKDKNKEDKTPKICSKPLVGSELPAEKLVDKNLFEKNTKKNNEEPKNGYFRDGFNFLYDEHESIKLPCEFCGDLIISNDLMLHQTRCSLYMTGVYNGTSRRNRSFYCDEDTEKKIACGMCNKFFRLSLLENHQIYCQRNPTKSFKNLDKVTISKNLKAMNMKSEQGIQNGLEPSSPQLTRVGTRSEWLSEYSNTNEIGRDVRINLNQPESGVVTKVTKVSRKNRRAPSPPRR